MLHLGTLATQKIVPHLQTMFHIYSSATTYLCAKYTLFFYIGEKRLGGHPSSEETPHLWKKVKYTQDKQSRRRKTWWKLEPQQMIVMLWIQILSPRILIREIMGCNRDLENIKKNINDVLQKNKNIIDVLGRV
ncbi:hypothetical protein AB205_0128420 [Aquarana catesbeiana]|uniref:Uncharacterized protein n=1 Tax=Aquarana catesbeiana TaxID=8400 RepID=A0A2G9RTM9_AQUCT|nr:hypothetical protein AB205_0128420 [Aquarana catesbeiana]